MKVRIRFVNQQESWLEVKQVGKDLDDLQEARAGHLQRSPLEIQFSARFNHVVREELCINVYVPQSIKLDPKANPWENLSDPSTELC